MKDPDANILLRSIPAMDELLNTPWAALFSASMGREHVKKIIAQAIEDIRREIRGEFRDGIITKESIHELTINRAMALLQLKSSGTLKPVVNAAGVIIHTNLGRAPLALQAIEAVNKIAKSYSTLEYSLQEGVRGERNSHIEELVCRICGAEAALVVNNNAAAVLLALSAVAAGREVIVACGELVEIGGSFRIPDILSFSGAAMTIAGCTNSSRISDYSNAITENTAALLKVHPSNYRIEGYTASASRRELAQLASERGIVLMEDLGSGLVYSPGVPFAHREHSVRESIEAGVGIVTFSGDKLLGGPQIGVIAGSKRLVDKMKSHQLYRALRVDKMTLAAFEATLRLYFAGRQLEIPVINMIEMDIKALEKKARRLCRLLKQTAENAGSGDLDIKLVQASSVIGGGTFPTDLLPGFGVGISPVCKTKVCKNGHLRSAESLAAAFRTANTPVISGIRSEQVILHVRTLLDGDEQKIACALAEILSKNGGGR